MLPNFTLKPIFSMKQNLQESLMKRISEKPFDYPICMNWQKCPKRERCLHAQETTAEKCRWQVVHCINPLLYAEGKDCVQFRDKDEKCRYAFGFTRQAERLKARGKYKEFMALCQRYFCRTVFFEMRSGQKALSPGDQQYIIRCAAEVGYAFPEDGFDQMIEVTKW